MYLTIVKCFNKEHPQKPHAEIKACVAPHEYLFSSKEDEDQIKAEILARIYNVQRARLFQRKQQRIFQNRYAKIEKQTLSRAVNSIKLSYLSEQDKEYISLLILTCFDMTLEDVRNNA